jgi:hypothetical protein
VTRPIEPEVVRALAEIRQRAGELIDAEMALLNRVRVARYLEVGWELIGEALGVSADEAVRRFGYWQ